MQLPDETLSYSYQNLLIPPGEVWSPAAELRATHFLSLPRLRELLPKLLQVRSQVAAERELQEVPPEQRPLEAGFIDLPQKMLDDHRRKAEASVLGRVVSTANRLREFADRIVVLGAGNATLGPRALFEAVKSAYHNYLSPSARLGTPRLHFEGNHLDNDALQDMMDLLQVTCVDPEKQRERWAVIVVSKGETALETAAAYRVFRHEAAEFYGLRSPRIKQAIVPIAGPNARLRALCKADGYDDNDILTIPENVGERFAVFTPAGLVPAAVVGLDVRALLLGAAAMTKRFLEEPFERNPVLQFAAVNHLMTSEIAKPVRVLAVWTRKLETLGQWYELLLGESLARRGQGPNPLTVVQPRDLHARGHQLQEGRHDAVVNNLIVRAPRQVPIQLGMADHNQDELNSLARKTYPELRNAALTTVNEEYFDAARPTANLELPVLSEHTLGQLMQLLMLATVVEAKLMGINPYTRPVVEGYQRRMLTGLKEEELSRSRQPSTNGGIHLAPAGRA